MTKPIPVRLTDREIEKVEELITKFSNISPGKVTRADIIRYAISEMYDKNFKKGSYESN